MGGRGLRKGRRQFGGRGRGGGVPWRWWKRGGAEWAGPPVVSPGPRQERGRRDPGIPPDPPDTAPDVSSRRSRSRPPSTSLWVRPPRPAHPCREPGRPPSTASVLRARPHPGSAPSRLSPCPSLPARLTVSYSRSSGPGGQNVNKGEEQLLPWKNHHFR